MKYLRKYMGDVILLVVLGLIVFCTGPDESFKKTASGLEYRIIPGNGKEPVAGSGATVKLHHTWYRRDTIWQTSRNNKPFYQPLMPGLVFPYDPFESLIYGVKEGDSVIVRLRLDSLKSKGRIDSLPAGTKISDIWTVGIKVLKVFPFDPLKGDSLVLADKISENRIHDSLMILKSSHSKHQ